jgi:hypothetical protein
MKIFEDFCADLTPASEVHVKKTWTSELRAKMPKRSERLILKILGLGSSFAKVAELADALL